MIQLTRAMATLGLPEVAVVGENNNLMIQGVDSDGKIQDNYSLTIGTTKNTFKVIFKTDNLKLLPDDYEIKAAKIGDLKIPVAHFVGKNENIQYWIAVGKDSIL
jgi:hypothetical protein